MTLFTWLRGRLQSLPFEGPGNSVYLVECEVAELTI